MLVLAGAGVPVKQKSLARPVLIALGCGGLLLLLLLLVVLISVCRRRHCCCSRESDRRTTGQCGPNSGLNGSLDAYHLWCEKYRNFQLKKYHHSNIDKTHRVCGVNLLELITITHRWRKTFYLDKEYIHLTGIYKFVWKVTTDFPFSEKGDFKPSDIDG